MPDIDIDTDMPHHVYRMLLIICGMIGLVVALIWWAWPGSIDPLSSNLSRTLLFNRQPIAPHLRPVVIDLNPGVIQTNSPDQAVSAAKLHRLLEQLMADAPPVIALVDTGPNATAFLKGLSIVAADPQAPTVLLPSMPANHFPNYDLAAITPNQLIGLRTPDGKLHFNVLAKGIAARGFANRDPALALRFAARFGEQSPPAFALVVASRYEATIKDGKNDDARVDLKPVWAQRTNLSPDEKFIVLGEHRRFYDHYPATAILNRRVPRGTFRDRIVLLGVGPGKDIPGALASPGIITPVTSTAIRVWALLNGQIARRPQWSLWVEWGLILGLALCPAVLARHFPLPVAWIASGALACSLVLGSTLVWHMSGVMIQIGAAVLGLLLSGLNASLLRHGHQHNLTAATLPARSHSGWPRSAPPHGNSAVVRSAKLTEISNPPDTEPQATGMSSPPVAIVEETAAREKIGRYEILRCIGKGAMGEVFLGRDPHINRLTAIKTLRFKDNFVEDEIAEIKDKFFREAESAGTLSHANIVTIYDAGEDQDRAYIAMEYLEGITLLRFTRAKRLLPVRKIIAYSVQIAEALDYAHRRGIVHRDIKPANIMVLKNGAIKITDFGIARITASSHTQTGVVKGTPYYMSPEQFSGAKVDGRSDIFSMGTMLFQLLTGTLPFFSESPAVLMNQIMNFPHPNPQAINPRVMPAIIPIVDKALEKERRRRYAKASLMAADLTKLNQRIRAYLQRKSRSDQKHSGRRDPTTGHGLT